jgi:hypothetical protein
VTEVETTAALAALATCRSPVTIVGTSERTSLAKLALVMYD